MDWDEGQVFVANQGAVNDHNEPAYTRERFKRFIREFRDESQFIYR